MDATPSPATGNVARPYTVDEVAAILGLARRTVREHALAGRLPAVRVGKLYRFPRARIDAIATGDAAAFLAQITSVAS